MQIVDVQLEVLLEQLRAGAAFTKCTTIAATSDARQRATYVEASLLDGGARAQLVEHLRACVRQHCWPPLREPTTTLPPGRAHLALDAVQLLLLIERLLCVRTRVRARHTHRTSFVVVVASFVVVVASFVVVPVSFSIALASPPAIARASVRQSAVESRRRSSERQRRAFDEPFFRSSSCGADAALASRSQAPTE